MRTLSALLAFAIAIATAGTPALAAFTCGGDPPRDCPPPVVEPKAEERATDDDADETESET